jgi:hypothetical protein
VDFGLGGENTVRWCETDVVFGMLGGPASLCFQWVRHCVQPKMQHGLARRTYQRIILVMNMTSFTVNVSNPMLGVRAGALARLGASQLRHLLR